MKIKKGDNVIVITGKNKGQKGTIMKVFRTTDRVIIEGVNKIKRHIKSRTRGEKGRIVEVESPIHVSNVMLVDSKTGTGTRVGKKVEDGKVVRFAKKSNQTIK